MSCCPFACCRGSVDGACACVLCAVVLPQLIAAIGDCPGFAPDAELYIFRVFTSKQGVCIARDASDAWALC